MSKGKLPDRKIERGVEPQRSSGQDISAFLKSASALNPGRSGRLVFSLDATMSRQPTWDRACQIQASMFEAVGKTGGLSVQLVYFRGYGECRASKWVVNASALASLMGGISCRGGQTQIGKVLAHVSRETAKKKVSALVFIGDAMEEDIDHLCMLAGKLGVTGTKAFMFLEGNDPLAEAGFREIARLTGGAFMRLGSNSAKELADLLSAVAVYASGGHTALEASGNRNARLLLEQMKGSR